MSYRRLALACAAVGCMLAVGGATTQARKATGCPSVPASGFIGPNVYASSGTHASTAWSWTNSSSNQPFHWYVFNSSNQVVADGYTADGSGGSTAVSSGNHYWKVQNLGSTNQRWAEVCWS